MLKNDLERANKLDLIRAALANLVALNLDEVLRKDLGSTFSFEPLERQFQYMKSRLLTLQGIDLTECSVERLDQLQNAINELDLVHKSLVSFKLDVANPLEARSRLLEDACNRLDVVQTSVDTQIAIQQSLDVQEIIRRQAEPIAAIVDEARKASSSVNQILQDAKNALDGIQKAAGESGTAQEAMHFRQCAEKHNTNARWALISSCVGLALFVVILTTTPLPNPPSRDWAELVPILTRRLPIAAASVVVVVASLKVFTAERHNGITNQHRAIALTTFRAFISGSNTKEVKDAILLQASSTAFGPAPTGYLKSPVEVQQVSFAGVTAKSSD